MKILIDGDGCPVVERTVQLAKKSQIPVFILCDTAHEIHYPGATTLVHTKGADSVDFALVNMAEEGDIIITQDYGLAAMGLAKKALVLNQNGMLYTKENIDGLLFARHASKKARMAGHRTKGPKKRRKEDNAAFERTLLEIFYSSGLEKPER